jgi:hypothetical protein
MSRADCDRGYCVQCKALSTRMFNEWICVDCHEEGN